MEEISFLTNEVGVKSDALGHSKERIEGHD